MAYPAELAREQLVPIAPVQPQQELGIKVKACFLEMFERVQTIAAHSINSLTECRCMQCLLRIASFVSNSWDSFIEWVDSAPETPDNVLLYVDQDNDALLERWEQLDLFNQVPPDKGIERRLIAELPFDEVASIGVSTENHAFNQERLLSRKITFNFHKTWSWRNHPVHDLRGVVRAAFGSHAPNDLGNLLAFRETGHTLEIYSSFDRRFIHIVTGE